MIPPPFLWKCGRFNPDRFVGCFRNCPLADVSADQLLFVACRITVVPGRKQVIFLQCREGK